MNEAQQESAGHETDPHKAAGGVVGSLSESVDTTEGERRPTAVAILWDVENTLAMPTAKTIEVPFTRKVGEAVLHYLRLCELEPCVDYQIIYTHRPLWKELREALTTLGFQVFRTRSQKPSAADRRFAVLVNEALRGKRAPLPPTVALVSDDGDFSHMMHRLQDAGHRVWVFGWKAKTNQRLRYFSDKFITIQDALYALRTAPTP